MNKLLILLGVFLLTGLATAFWGDVDSDQDGELSAVTQISVLELDILMISYTRTDRCCG